MVAMMLTAARSNVAQLMMLCKVCCTGPSPRISDALPCRQKIRHPCSSDLSSRVGAYSNAVHPLRPLNRAKVQKSMRVGIQSDSDRRIGAKSN